MHNKPETMKGAAARRSPNYIRKTKIWNSGMADVWGTSVACHPRATYHSAHCTVLPLGEFTVTILEPHATLQGAVTRRNQCHDRATGQGVRIPSAILKIVFRHILLFLFLMQFRV